MQRSGSNSRIKSRRGRIQASKSDEEEQHHSKRGFLQSLGSKRAMEDTTETARDMTETRRTTHGDDTDFSDTTTDDDSYYQQFKNPDLDKMLLDQAHKGEEPEGDFDPNDHWTTCIGRFCYEINPWQNWFLVDDPPFTKRTLDIPASFAPTGIWPIIGKLISLFSGLATLIWTFMVEENKVFSLAYLSTWNAVCFIIYMVCSLLNSLQGVAQPFSRVNGTVRIAWFMFIVTAHMGIMEAILYWGTEVDYEKDDIDYSFRNLMLHGGLALEAILDGFTVNFIPLRWMHWWGCCLVPDVLYALWTLVHAYFLWVGNPNEPDRNTIYKIISWRYDMRETLKWMLVAIFAISPVVFLCLWMMSLYKWFLCCCWRRERRMYLQTTGNLERYREMAEEAALQIALKNYDAEKKKAEKLEKKNKKQYLDEEDSESSQSELEEGRVISRKVQY